MSAERQQRIVEALRAELARQSEAGGASGKPDLLALATAVDAALGGDTLEAGPAPADVKGPRGAGSSPKEAAEQGLMPDQLDASNDE
jgi:hypothetical protein